MDVILVLFTLFLFLAGMVVIGHLIWMGVAMMIRWVFGLNEEPPTAKQSRFIVEPPAVPRAEPRPTPRDDLAAFERQLVQFYIDGKISDEVYEQLMARVRAERMPPASKPKPERVVEKVVVEKVVPESAPIGLDRERPSAQIPPPPRHESSPRPEPPPQPEPRYEPPPPPRRPFSEVLNAFMEESNIRWGEIIGGLLIIGCSTALVVSLWAQISQIPVLKFLIFTTVTAVLFGVGLYTEHRWKLPTTSRGILTIATLLVPLNFLAIAAVSASDTSGALVIGSELLAPAIFLVLVYFAGRVITPGCAHILSAGVLGSSIGQLLVRHFATPDSSPTLLIVLAAFPVVCYVVTVAFALRLVLADREVDANETPTVFTILGAMSFAALLPFGLLLYKAGPLSLTMMYLAPIVTLWGLPMLATGTVLWKRINNKELVASRTTGTALGILGIAIVLIGMVLAWPNPASIVPAALLNFAIFTALAIALELPVGHLIAANCLGVSYIVAFHVSAGRVAWQNLRVQSLLAVTLSLSTGQALAGLFVIFLIAAEWLSRKRRTRDSHYYLIAACLMAFVSLTLIALFGVWTAENHWLWLVFLVYSLGALWIAWRRTEKEFVWIGSGLLLFALADGFSRTFELSFPWQTAFLAHATLCAIAAIATARLAKTETFSKAFNYTALITVVFGVIALFQANTWEVTVMQAQRVFWIAVVLLLLLWLNRQRMLFNAFQIALLCAVVLTVKAALQQFEWYAYVPLTFLHPSALQIYGTVLALFCLVWVGLRVVVRRALRRQEGENKEEWITDAWCLLDTCVSIDRALSWLLVGAFILFATYGTLSGLTRELNALGSSYPGLNLAGFPHAEVFGIGSWIVLGLLAVLMVTSFRDRGRDRGQKEYLLGAVVVFSAAIPLLAGLFEAQLATVAAWRWLAAFFLLGGSIVLWYRRNETTALRVLLIVLTVAPLLLLTFLPALRAFFYLPVHNPISGVFAWLGNDVVYGGPLLIVAAVFVGYAVRERRPAYGLYGGLFVNAAVSLLLLLAVVENKGLIDRVLLVRLLQLNAITFAVYALPWLSTRRLWRQKLDERKQNLADDLLEVQVGLAVSLNVLLIVPVAIGLVFVPQPPGVGTLATGSLLGWLALATTIVAGAWLTRMRERGLSAVMLAAGLMAVSCLTGFSVAHKSGWLGLHVLTVCTVVSAWLMVAAVDRNVDPVWRSYCRRLAAAIGAIGVFLCLRTAVRFDEGWWSVGPLLGLSALYATLNWQTLRRRYIYAAGIILNLAASIWCITIQKSFVPERGLFAINIIAGSLASILWLWLELRSRRLRGIETTRSYGLSFHHLNAIGWPLLLTLLVLVSFPLNEFQSPLLAWPELHYLALASIIALMTACLWDRYAKYAVAGLYLLGLLAIAMLLPFAKNPEAYWFTTMMLTVYSLFVAFLWSRRAALMTFAQRWGVPARVPSDVTELKWLSAFTIIVAAIITVLAYWFVLDFSDPVFRVWAALAVIAQVITIAVLAVGVAEQRWRQAAIAVFVVGLTFFGWSWLTPELTGTWLNRSVILMLLAFGLTAVYGLLLEQARAYSPSWTTAAKSCVPALLVAGAIALFFCLGTEVWYQIIFGAVRIHALALTAIGATLVAAIVVCVVFALSPKHDPLGLTERGRMNYVYAAEVMLALLFLHVRLTLPWLFTGFLERYWPLVIMVIAYLGVVTSESLRRRKLLVLAQPLERTGVFLPLLPVLGFWLASSEVDFSLLLFVVGGLYGLLSILRRSFAFGLLAAVAGNGGLWYILHRTDDYQFLQHPQLWLIPIALSALIAAYLNEENLSEDQMTGVRYLSLVTIYVSSTADIFINGVANSPWLPLVLGSFSLAGVFAGIIFRIRGLLLLGAVFLLLSIITMIWYASANFGWTWLWYVAGIVTGATIIFMFAVFEKKRSEVLRLIEDLKEWEA
jgi:hypothetical protein